jgi:hypothetical protein
LFYWKQAGADHASLDGCLELASAVTVLQNVVRATYHQLKASEDWTLLYNHLLHQAGWCNNLVGTTSKEILERVFGNEIQNAVSMLLQGLSPLRFSFPYGQARIISLFYYLRKIVPCRDAKNVAPITDIPSITQSDILSKWTAGKGATESTCSFHTFAKEGMDSIKVTVGDLSKLKAISKEHLDALAKTSANTVFFTPKNLSDCIAEIIQTSVLDMTGSGLVALVRAKCLHVLQVVSSFDPLLQNKLLESISFSQNASVQEKARKAYDKIFGPDRLKVFHSLQSYRGACPALSVVMYILACALVDARSTYYLEICTNKDWLVPINTADQVDGVALEDLNKTTFLNGSMSTSFYPKYYAVSVEKHCQQCYAEMDC